MQAEKSGRRMRHIAVQIAALAGAVGLALCAGGCAGSGPPVGSAPSDGAEPPADAPIQDAVDCRSEPSSGMMLDPSATPDPSIPVPGRVPEGFEASAALLCVVDWIPMEEEVDLAPTDEGQLELAANVQRLEGDLTGLLVALAEPDDAVPTDVMCTADLEIVPALWLEDSAGRVVPVHYPRDVCGKTKPAVHDALDGLDITAVEPWSLP